MIGLGMETFLGGRVVSARGRAAAQPPRVPAPSALPRAVRSPASVVRVGGRESLPAAPGQNSRGSGYGMATSMDAGELVRFSIERVSFGAR